MRFETLADLIEAYNTGELLESNPLIIDRDQKFAYVAKPGVEDFDEEEEFENKYLFYLNLSEVAFEAIEILGIPSESD